ncbi:ribosomal protein S11 (apicoplast) [Theileria orientalis]|uniref:Ribosomal protein S11 n=1 Tax=Theileria orientalis TaxID=68886 RepID=A0A976SI39_THEOR|nr:ribosomal protein S11 [Theileria orientalis]
MNIKYQNNKQKFKKNYDLIVVCVSFKLNNIFISVSKFVKFFEVFHFNNLLKSYSCGMFNLKNKNKTSIKAYNLISQELNLFLMKNNIKKINLIFKSSHKINYMFINTFLNKLKNNKFIKILNIYFKLSIPSNGCRLQKHKFL